MSKEMNETLRARIRAAADRAQGLFTIRRLDDDFAQELESHLAMLTDENIRQGMSPDEAKRAARLKLGGEASLRETHHDQRTFPWLESLWQDVRFAFRMLRKNPSFTVVAVLTLALGIGANTAIFSIVNGVLLDRLPYAKPGQLLELNGSIRIGDTSFNGPLSREYADAIRADCPAFEGIAGFSFGNFTMIAHSTPEFVSGARVSSGLFPLLGVHAMLGRTILPGDAQTAGDVVVLSYRVWQRSLGSDPRAVGRTVTLDNKVYTIVGVMPRDFEFPLDGKGIWIPLSPPDGFSAVIGRLRDDSTRTQVNGQLKALAARLRPGVRDWSIVARELDEGLSKERSQLPLLLAAVALVLIVACLNVSTLLLVRASARKGEISVREALGATRWRIVRQLLTEGTVLAVLGCALALLFAPWSIHAIRLIAPPQTPRLDNVRIDSHVLWFSLGISILSAAAFGLAPALELSGGSQSSGLRENLAGFRTGGASYSRHLRDVFVFLEIALAVVLAVGAALTARSFGNLLSVSTGLRTDHILTMAVHFSRDRCDGLAQCHTLQADVLDQIRVLPQVASAAFSSSLPLRPGMVMPGTLRVEGLPGEQGFAQGVQVLYRAVSPEYFRTLGIRLLRGRLFDADDTAASDGVVVNESFVRRFFLHRDPFGKHISFSNDKNRNPVWTPIVGIVSDSRDVALADKPRLEFYVPYGQLWIGGSPGFLMVRTADDPFAMLPSIRDKIWTVDKDAPITDVLSMDQVVADSVGDPRFRAVLLGAFGVLGFLLAMVGTYGVVSFNVSRRTHEIGVRVALGAGREDILRLVLTQGMLPAVLGAVAGIVGALGLARFLRSFLFGVGPADPATFAVVGILVLFAALCACYIPARRAMRVDPVTAMRCE